LTKAIDLLHIDQLSTLLPPAEIVAEDQPVVEQQLSDVWTKSMESAFRLAKENTLRLHKRIGRLLSTLRIIKGHLVLSYAFSSNGDSTLSPDHDDRFARMLNDCRQLGELAMNTDADHWKELLMDAEQIREKIQPLCNTDRQGAFL
jgi:hypothetical protein